jgi:ABC-2 type transport system ATP-binding protein
VTGHAEPVRHADRMAPVVVADVTKRYYRRGPAVLDGVRLSLDPGSITQLRGSNGSGKSTLLRLLAGVTAPSAGRVEGRPAAVGYVPERFPSDVRFTPRQYVGWLGRVRGTAAHEVTATVEELAGVLGLPARILDQPMRDLSKGTTQKVVVIQALLASPSLLLLDEAWTGLDTDGQAALTQVVRDRRTSGSVVVFADHGDRAQGLRPDATYLVLDGGLTPVVASAARPSAASMRLELVGPPDRAPAVTALEGVRSADLVADGLVVVVASGRADEVLAAVLAAGWSVRSAGPA